MSENQTPGGSWLASFTCTRAEARALSEDLPAFAIEGEPPVLVTAEVDEASGAWRLDAYFEEKPGAAELGAVHTLLPSAADAPLPEPEYLPPADWVSLSQQGLEPVRAGRFHVHTSDHAPDAAPGVRNLLIDPAQAFGTGHHETTHGCLAMLDRLESAGARYANIADIGTGTGLLAFAARHLWPAASILASDIDEAAVRSAARYAQTNGVALGRGRGQVALVTANGTDHRLTRRKAPYDLVVANILAGPLVELAPAFAAIAAPGGTLILAGLLDRQREQVTRAYRSAGFRLAEVGGDGQWSTLRLIRRRRFSARQARVSRGRARAGVHDFGEW